MDDIRLLDDDSYRHLRPSARHGRHRRDNPRGPVVRRWSLVLLVVAVIAGGAAAGASLLGGPVAPAAALKQAEPAALVAGSAAGCVVRFSTAGPRIHANIAHECSLGTELRVLSNGRLQLLGAPDRPVVTLSCQPDESLVVRGIDCGPSGGSGQIVYQLTYNGKAIDADSYRLVCSVCNLWLGGTYA